MFSSKAKPSYQLVLTSVLTGSLTILFSVTYICLTILGLIFRYNCNAYSFDSIQPANLFMDTVYRTYILSSDDCNDSAYTTLGITSDHSVFVLNTITLCFSVASLIAAIVLISVLTSDSEIKWFRVIVFSYVGVVVSNIIIDITIAAHFGMDYTYLTNEMNSNISIQTEYQRLGALLFMCVSLKGFLGPAINIVLLILLVVYAVEYLKEQNGTEHSIHALGAISAFDTPKRNEFCNHPCENCRALNKEPTRSNGGGSQLNYGFLHDEEPSRSPRNLPNSSPRLEYPNSSGFNRSNSWQSGPPSARPFSYLDDVKKPTPLRAPASPSSDSAAWRREPWQPAMPPVPAPDYSPHGPRRLKSALKSYL